MLGLRHGVFSKRMHFFNLENDCIRLLNLLISVCSTMMKEILLVTIVVPFVLTWNTDMADFGKSGQECDLRTKKCTSSWYRKCECGVCTFGWGQRKGKVENML